MLGNLSLKARLTLVLCVFGVLAVVAAGYVTRTVVQDQTARDQGAILSLNAQRVAARLERQLGEHVTQLRLASEVDALRDPAASVPARTAALESMRRADLHLKWVAVVNEGGAVLASAGEPSTTPAVVISLVSGGNAAAQAPASAGAVSPSAARVATLPQGSLAIRLPLGTEARRSGAIVAEMDTRWLTEVRGELENRASAERIGLVLLDREGRIRAASGMKDAPANNMVDWLKAARAEGDAARERAWPDGGSYLTAVVPAAGSAVARQLDWVVAARRPSGEVFAAANELITLLAAIGVSVVALFGGMMWFVLNRQLRPLVHLTAATERIRHNDMSGAIPVPPGQGEITEFARTLASLMSDLQSRHAQLRLFSRIYEESRDGIMVADDQLRFLHINAAFTRITGYTLDDVAGHSITLLRRDASNRLFMANMLEAVQKFGRWEGEVRSLASDGHIYNEWLSLAALRDDQGRITHYIGIFEDISEIKRNTEELEQHRTRMEELLQVRTAALTKANNDLVAAREAADQANRAKSDFLANMSHEIRTPMNAILGLAHLLGRSLHDPRQLDQVGKITTAARHLLDIINDILDLSKIEAGKLRLEMADFRIEQVVDYVFSLIVERARGRNLELVIDTDGVPPMLNGDLLRLGQVLLNFASNSVKFTESGSITLKVRALATRPEGTWLRFEVTDTGIGMTPEQLSRIFEAFEQADTSTSRKYGGTGLGLTISRRLVQLMGGRIGVDSEYGKGTTGWIEVPLKVSQATPQPLLDAELRQRLPADTRVLLIDDMQNTRNAIGHLLRDAQLFSVKVADADAGARVLAEADAQGKPFALVLCDAELPDNGALKVRRAVQQGKLSVQPALLLTTIHSLETLRVPSGNDLAPCAATIEKPVTRANFVAALQQALLGAVASVAQDGSQSVALMEELIRRRGGARVLIAEDNPINQEVSKALLREVGIDADIAEDGQVAVEKAREKDYELILMDMQMPVTDGLVATRMIRQLPQYRDVPILALTANAFDESREACLDAGMNAHLSKPIDPVELYKALTQWLPGMTELAEENAEALGLSQPGALPGEEADAPAPTAAPSSLGIDMEFNAPASRAPVPPPPPAPAAAPAKPADPAADLHARLGHIRGLDIKAGLNTSGGLTEIYVDMLHMFLETEIPQRMTQDAASGDMEALRKSVHSFKGVTGTLGLSGLRTATIALETELRATPPTIAPQDTPARVQAIVEEFETLCADLRACLPPPTEVA